MSFDKNYPKRKDKRKQYPESDPRSCSTRCRNNGDVQVAKVIGSILQIKEKVLLKIN